LANPSALGPPPSLTCALGKMTSIPTCIAVARQFGDWIAKEDYLAAHSLLTTEAQKTYSPDDFKKAVIRMTRYAPGPIQEVAVMDDILEDWPAKQGSDVASIYVALSGDGFCEAAYLTIAREGADFRIRDIEWGRP
jgi:hypothetical protein